MFDYAKDNMERKPYEFYMEEYRKADPRKISNRLGIAYDIQRSELTIWFMGVNYRVSHPDFRITHEKSEKCVYPLEDDIYAKILVLRYLLNASVFLHNGEFRAYRELPAGDLYNRQFQGRCIYRLNREYGNRLETIEQIMDELDAIPVNMADMGYELEIFEDLYLRFLFWKGDEEFPVSSQILFSSNFPAAFDTYDLAEICEICICTFKKIERKL